jgi:hypothetical protein
MRIPFRCIPLGRVAALACTTALAPYAVAAQPAPSGAQMLSGEAPAPEVMKANGVDYLTGGVSIDGRAQLKPLVKDMNLQLVFAEKQTGAYLAQVEVSIADSKGAEVLKVADSEPMVFADLEPGTYSVKAKTAKGTLEREVTVPSRGRRTELFLWG